MAIRRIWGAMFCLLLAVLPLRPAAAHAVLELAVPADRAVLQEAPHQFSLRFDEAVAVTDLRLLDPAGRPVPIETNAADGAIDGTIGEALSAGTYTIAYRIISADGHPVAGAVQFQVGAGVTHWTEPQNGLAWWQWGKLAVRWVLYLGAFIAWGTVMRRLRGEVTLQAPARPPIPLRVAAGPASLAAILAALVAIGLQGSGMSGGGWHDLLWPAIWRSGATQPDGRVALLIGLGLGLAWLAWQSRHLTFLARFLVARFLMAASAVLIVAAFATSGHVPAIGWSAAVVLAIHVLCALFWIGSLGALLRRPVAQPSTRVAAAKGRRRAVIAGALIAGFILACWQIVTLPMMVSTAYGWVLTAKILAMLLVLGLIAANRWGPVPARPARRRFLAWGQAILLIGILGLTAALGQLTPPRHLLAAEEAAAAQAVSGHGGHGELLDTMVHLPDAMAEISLEGNGAGRYNLAVWLDDIYERRLNPQQVTVSLTNLDAGIGPLSRDLTLDPEDHSYVLRDLSLAPAGRWRVEVKADISDFERRIFRAEVVVPE